MVYQNLIYISIVLRSILLIMNIYFAIEVYKKYRKFELNVISIIGLINVFSAFGLFIEILHLINAPIAIFTQIGTLYTFLGILVAYLLLIYLDLYGNTHLNAYRFTVTTLLASFTFMTSIDAINDELYESQTLIAILIEHTPLLFVLYTLVTARIIINKMQLYASTHQIKLMNFVKYYVYFGFVGYSILQPVRDIIWRNNQNNYTSFEQVWVLIIPAFMLIIGNIFLYLGYIRPDQPSALSPQKIDRFIIINNEGIPIFNLDFDNKQEKFDETLLSGAMSAITAVLKEATQIAGDLKSIEIGNQHLMIRKYKGLTGVLFTYLPTSFLHSLLSKIMERINELYQVNKYNQLTDTSYDHFNNVIKTSFGYSVKI